MNKELREKLAELEHEQWMRWSNYLVTNYKLPKEIVEKWRISWKPYKQLTEAQKEKDRIWADKVLSTIKSYLLENGPKEYEIKEVLKDKKYDVGEVIQEKMKSWFDGIQSYKDFIKEEL